MARFRRAERLAAVSGVFRGLAVSCVFGLLLSVPLRGWSQGLATGAIRGRVVDADGHRLAYADLTATNVTTGEESRVRAAANGSFLLVLLTPGEYRLALPGAPAGTTVEVTPGVASEVKATLSSSGSHMLLETGAATPMQAGIEPDENDDGMVTVRGMAASQDGAALDGVNANQEFGGVSLGAGSDRVVDPDADSDSAEQTSGPSHGLGRGRHAGVAYQYASESVREFRIGTDDYGAEVRSAGSVLSVVSRQGGSKLHGSAFFRLRSSALAAKDPLAIATSYLDGMVTSAEVKPHDLRERFGGSFGGPVSFGGKPKTGGLRFFDAVDVQRRGFPAVSSPADANFYNLTAMQTDLLATRGVSGMQVNAALNYLSSLTGETRRRADQEINFARADWRVRPWLGLAAEYNLVRWRSPAGLLEAPVVARARASLGNAAGSVDEAVVRTTVERSSRTANELRLGLMRDAQYETPQTPLAQEPVSGVSGLAPEVTIGPDGLLFGTPAGLSERAYPDEQRMEAADTATLIRGRNTIAFGGTFAYVRDHIATLANAAGSFRYDSGETKGYAGGLVDFITDQTFNANAAANGGCPRINAAAHFYCFRSFTQNFGEQDVAFSTQQYAGFAEDTWRPRQGLTLHAGLRYEYTLLPLPQQPNAALDALFGARGATGVLPEDRNNLAPRISAAFEPMGRGHGVVRLGYGVFFGRIPGATIEAALADTGQASATTSIRIRPTIETVCPQVPATGFGYPCSFTEEPTGVVAQTTSSVVFDRHFRVPVVQQGSLFVEHGAGRATTLSLGVVVNEDHQLPSSTDLNIAPSTGTKEFQLQGGDGRPGVRDGETFVVPAYTARVSPGFGPVTDVVSHANGTYDGLVARVESRSVRDLQMGATYTWSKAIDFGQAESAVPRTDGQFDPFANGYDKALSALNYPQTLHAEAVWTPAVESGGSKLRRAANGWSISGIETARSGRPYSYELSGGTDLPGGHESVNGSGGALYLPTVGRNTLRLPPTVKTDVRVGRGFRTWRGGQGLAAVEAYNLFNHQSVSSVEQRAYLVGTETDGVTPLVFQNAAAIASEGLNTPAFGTTTSTGSELSRERQIELSLRLSF